MSTKIEEYNDNIKKIKRQLYYKFPVTLRYGFAIGFFIGIPFAYISRKPSNLLRSMLFFTICFGFGTCTSEFINLGKNEYNYIYSNLNFEKK